MERNLRDVYYDGITMAKDISKVENFLSKIAGLENLMLVFS